MATLIEWYDSTETAIAAASQVLGDGGTPGTAVELRVYNDKLEAGADTLTNARLTMLARETGEPSGVEFGDEVVDRGYIEARIVSGLGGKTATGTDWRPLGGGSYLPLPALASGEGLKLEFRVNGPSDAQSIQRLGELAIRTDSSVPVPLGITEARGDGVYLPLGDPLATVLISGADVVENPGGADDEVQVGPFRWIAAGVPYTLPEQLQALTPAASGLVRYDLLSLGPGTLTVTAGTEEAGPLTPDDVPATPSGGLAIAFVEVDDSGVVNTADVTNLWSAGLYNLTTSGLTATVAAGPRALVDNALTYNEVAQTASLTASETNSIWLRRSGGLAVTVDGLPPEGTRALLLWEADTDASNVTAIRDRRRWIGGTLAVLRFEWTSALSAGLERFAVNPSDRTAYVLPIRGLRAAVGDPGSVSGQTRFGLEVDSAFDDSWATDLAGTDDPPVITFGAADPRHLTAVPAAYAVPGGARLRATIEEVPGTPGADAVLEVLLWLR